MAAVSDHGADPFWGPAAVGSIGRMDDRDFFGHPTPPPSRILARWAQSRTKLAAVLLGTGFFAVFLNQAPLHIQLVIGAPVFEETFKFGLAMLLVAWLPARGALRIPAIALRCVSGLAVGAGFGWMEHHLTYASEDQVTYWGRITFHALTTALSMLAYSVLEPAAEVRTRWLSTVPATFVHYLNNGFGVVFVLLAAPFGTDAAQVVGLSWAAGCLAVLALLCILIPVRAQAARRLAHEAVARHFPEARVSPKWPAPGAARRLA